MPVGFEPILGHVPAFALVLFRITGLFIWAPMFGGKAVPRRVKALLAFALALCVYPMLLDPTQNSAQMLGPFVGAELNLWMLAPAAAMELLIGLVMGYGVSLPLIGAQIGGKMIDQQIGLGLAGLYNPELEAQGGIVGQFYFILGITAFLLLGGHVMLLMGLVGSFNHIAPGGMIVGQPLIELVIKLLTMTYEMAFRLAAPLLCLVFLETIALGFIARTVPQMNILSIGFPLRILLGVLLMIAATVPQAKVIIDGLQQALLDVTHFVGM